MQSSVTEERYRYLGGSDISSIMELSPFTSRFEMLKYKAQIDENEFSGNDYTTYGNDMESKIRDYINEYYSMNFVEDKKIVENENGIDTRYHADGRDDDHRMLLEVKTTSEIHECVKDYKMYLVQLLFGMETYGYELGLLAVYERPEDMSEEFDKDRLQVFEVNINDYDELLDEIHQAINSFNIDLNYLKENPFAEEDELPSRKLIEQYKEITVNVGEIAVNALDLLFAEKEIKDAIAEIKDGLCKAMGENSIKRCDTQLGRITYVPQGSDTETVKLDEKRLKEELPEVYAKYTKKSIRKGKKAYVRITHKAMA